MAVILGKNVFVYAGTSGTTPVIAGAKSCTISEKCDLIEIASASNQSSKQFLAGRTEWEVSISHLVLSSNEYQGLIKVGTSFTISVVINGVRKTGTVICNYSDIGGAAGSLASGSVRLKGSGALT
jgi:predicted secreted protein